MSTDTRFARLRELFEEVCDLPAEQRSAYLRKAGADAALIAEVEALLAAETDRSRQVSAPVAALIEAIHETEVDVGARIGSWRLQRKLASGGMGAVYLAERADGHFEQQSAIKLLRGFPTSAALERLAEERQILAGLQHPHIARLLDGGATPGGQPFLVMEYVDGVPIDQWCTQQALDLRARLRLFRNVCRALAFAHQRLIVHCDLKPSNVMVRKDGSPVVLDFGIARALDRSRDAMENAVFYTPGYASPEQINGQPVSVASDIYSLGLILFELVAGRKARLNSNDQTVTQLARAQVRPSEIASSDLPWKRGLRGDLDAIVLRATSERPALRYASADAMADDLERHLDLKPVAARAQTRRYRYGRLVRRRWPLFAAGALSILMFCAFSIEVLGERNRALQAEADARRQAQTAERVSEFLVSVFEFANPEKNPQKREISAREVLDAGTARIETELAGEPATRARLSDVLARAYWMLGQPARALELYQQAATLWQAPAVQQPLEAAESLSKLAVLQNNNHFSDAAQRNARLALQLRQDAGADEKAMADSWNTLGLTDMNAGRLDQAEVDFRRSLDIRTRLFGADSSNVAATLHNLGLLYGNQGKPNLATAAFEKSLAIKRREHASDVHPDVLVTLENYATNLSQIGRTSDAIPLLRQVLEARRKLDGGDSDNVASAYNELGSALHDAGRFLAAAENYREALRIRTAFLGRDSSTSAQPLNNLASALEDFGDFEAAEPLFRESLQIRRKLLPPDDPMVARAENNLARILVRTGQFAAARPLQTHAFATRLTRFGAGHVETAKSQLLEIALLRGDGKLDQAESALVRLDATDATWNATVRSAREHERALLAIARHRPADALIAARAAYRELEQTYGATHPLVAAAAVELADALQLNAQDDEARKLLIVNRPIVDDGFAPRAPVRLLAMGLATRLACCAEVSVTPVKSSGR